MTVQEEIFMEKETEKQNLGSGSIPGLMIKLAVPTIIAQLVNLLYNLVDRIYIGHIREVGDIALTGLGLCFPVLMMVTAFAMLIGSGGAPRAAIYMGKGDNETAERILGNSVTSLIVISVVLTIFLEAVAEPILWMFGASEKTLPFALGYMRIYVAGVNKAMGINEFASYYGFDVSRTIAFGDGGNDISMIRAAGMGIAMGGASEAVKSVADYITEAVDENGVRNALVRFGILE